MSKLVTTQNKAELKLKIKEIFYSIQGETSSSGYPTVFVRLTGCPLRCNYCDSSYAFSGGSLMTLNAILDKVASYNAKYITVTGGEPLAQKNCLPLLKELCDKYQDVSLETSGAIDISSTDIRVRRIVDIKTPDSGEVTKNYLDNIKHLKDGDEVKFVLCSHNDFLWAKGFVETHELIGKAPVLFSPSYKELSIKDLAAWILEHNLDVRLQDQLHKAIWGDIPGK